MPVPVSIVIPTFNEESQIESCIASVSWSGEIIVADAGSTDETVHLAAATGARVIHCRGLTIAGQRNRAIATARYKWVLAIDADERADSELQDEIGLAVAAPLCDAYAIRRRNFFLGREMRFGGWGSDWVVRLFPRSLRYVERRVHEYLEPVRRVERLQSTLSHVPYRDLAEFHSKMLRYTEWAAEDARSDGVRNPRWRRLTHPAGRFLRMTAWQGGVLDGWRGVLLAWLAARGVHRKYHLLSRPVPHDARRPARG